VSPTCRGSASKVKGQSICASAFISVYLWFRSSLRPLRLCGYFFRLWSAAGFSRQDPAYSPPIYGGTYITGGRFMQTASIQRRIRRMPQNAAEMIHNLFPSALFRALLRLLRLIDCAKTIGSDPVFELYRCQRRFLRTFKDNLVLQRQLRRFFGCELYANLRTTNPHFSPEYLYKKR